MTPTPEMTVSPLDRIRVPLAQLSYTAPPRWKPSRYNARMVAADGRMMLWNTLTGVVSEFRPEHTGPAQALLAPEGVAEPLDNLGRHLATRGFLVPAELDELTRFRSLYGQQQWRTDTMQLILLASEDCNFRCVYCYEKFKNGTMLPEVRQGVRNLVEQRAPRLALLTVNWFGGEPLYGWEAVEELAPFFRRTAARYGIKHSQDMTTNGYLLTEERATRLLEWGVTTYQITVDGNAADHDCKRVARDGGPTHAVILENLRSLRQRRDDGFTVTLRVNFDEHNLPGLAPFIEALSEDFGGDARFRLRFRAVGKWGGPNDDMLSTCGVGESRYVLDELRGQARSLGLSPEGGIEEVRYPGSQVCYAARPYNFIVGATGKLMKCTVVLDQMEENVVGRLTPEGMLELNEMHLLKWIAPHFETDELCKSCYVLPGCQGAACPLTRVQSGHRTCCGVKSELKREMRFSLAEMDRARGIVPTPTAAPEPAALAVAGG